MTNTTPPGSREVAARAAVSRNVRVAMARKGMHTVTALADDLNVDRRWVSRRLDGEVDYALSDLILLAVALDVTLAELVAGEV